MPQPGELERKLQGLVDKSEQVSDEAIRKDLQRQIDELKAQVEQGYKRFVESEDLEGTLKEVNSHVVLPKGKYAVDFDIVVKPQGTLEIEPGTEIYFGPKAGIMSFGLLKAIGKEDDRITFTGAQGYWKSIAVLGGLSKGTCFEYCAISYGGGREALPFEGKMARVASAGGALHIEHSDVDLSKCEISKCVAGEGGGIYVFNSKVYLKKCVLRFNEANHTGGAFYANNSDIAFDAGKILSNRAVIGNNSSVAGLDIISSDIVFINPVEIDFNKSGGNGSVMRFLGCHIKAPNAMYKNMKNNYPNNKVNCSETSISQ